MDEKRTRRARARPRARARCVVGFGVVGSRSGAVLTAEQLQNGYLPYTQDVYGCHGLLLSKRRSRNPFARFHSYYSSAPELGALFNWCPGADDEDAGGQGQGQTAVFKGPLPWDRLR